jgi:hypothetical protein
MKITGGCHCSNITYRAEGDPEKALVCHCTDCQVMSGSVYRTVLFVEEENFVLLSGELKTYIKTADGGNRRAMMFCPECGTQIYATAVETDQPRMFGIRLGTVDQRNEIVPKSEKYLGSKLVWVDNVI